MGNQLLRQSLTCALLCVSAFPASVCAAPAAKQSMVLPILTYHYVEKISNPKDKTRINLTIVPDVFEKQLTSLKERGYETVFVSEIPAIIEGIQTPNSKFIALTFDDGYEGFFTDAFPLLERYQMKATLFVISGFIDKPGYLTATQLHLIRESGLVEIGAHTVDHFKLPVLSSDRAFTQLSECKQTLEQLLGTTVTSFAYPFGKHSPRIVDLVKRAGYSAAVTTDFGYRQSSANLFTLRRIPADAFLGSRKWRAVGG